jgi:methylated-DNA-[protein]-cysteine S-methyltransferase
MTIVRFIQHDSPVGALRLAASERGLRAVYLPKQRHMPDEPPPAWSAIASADDPQARMLDEARRQLDAYFAGSLKAFALPLDAEGTAFQRAVWAGLCAIPYGTTISYGELARRIGQPTAVRAVGMANGRNPVSIVVPCHRVIGADGSMTGYGGGLERKVFLLGHEAGIPGDVRHPARTGQLLLV